MTDTEIAHLIGLYEGIASNITDIKTNIEHIRDNEDKLFTSTNNIDRRLTTIETQHADQMKAGACSTNITVNPPDPPTIRNAVLRVLSHPSITAFLVIAGLVALLVILKDMGLRFS